MQLRCHACAHVSPHVSWDIRTHKAATLRAWPLIEVNAVRYDAEACVRPWSIAQRTIWARLVNPNLERMLAMCFSTVRLLNTSAPAISPFDFHCAISATTSR